ncbi:hypothetical protein OIU79_024350 [Salix purpurea]|uniref:Uncharacterized protein n=1 Tax=Salix purpurea TaxID=77065 RepID=A0A9Q1A9Y4_SALPP|nr:hypothetical protein OIU79_024350 [Salix purpurea]
MLFDYFNLFITVFCVVHIVHVIASDLTRLAIKASICQLFPVMSYPDPFQCLMDFTHLVICTIFPGFVLKIFRVFIISMLHCFSIRRIHCLSCFFCFSISRKLATSHLLSPIVFMISKL